MFLSIAKKLRIDSNKNSKFYFYIKGLWVMYAPNFLYRKDFDKLYDELSLHDKGHILDRVEYYNKLDKQHKSSSLISIKEFARRERKRTYFFDLLEYLRYFFIGNGVPYVFGDVTEVPERPSIVKSRPINGDNSNSIIMKLNKVRHFIFVNDKVAFEDKKDQLVWRGKVHSVQKHRVFFMQRFFDSEWCDVGQINNTYEKWKKDKLSLEEQLCYKFILAIEGNDVASNLKWIMSSNSLAFMVKPKYETWFMEGRLIPNYHYVLLKDDYSDLEEKIKYYSRHADEAKEIVANANRYVEQFKDGVREDIISVMVLKKYFKQSGQADSMR